MYLKNVLCTFSLCDKKKNTAERYKLFVSPPRVSLTPAVLMHSNIPEGVDWRGQARWDEHTNTNTHTHTTVTVPFKLSSSISCYLILQLLFSVFFWRSSCFSIRFYFILQLLFFFFPLAIVLSFICYFGRATLTIFYRNKKSGPHEALHAWRTCREKCWAYHTSFLTILPAGTRGLPELCFICRSFGACGHFGRRF